MINQRRLIKVLLFTTVLHASTHPVQAGADDVLKPGRFIKLVSATSEQKNILNAWVDSLRSAISDHQFEYGRRTNEGRLWQGFAPRLKDLHQLEKRTRTKTDGFLDSIRAVLSPKQAERLKRVLKKHDLLSYPIAPTPFQYISTSPTNPKFDNSAKAYRVAIPGAKTVASGWGYKDLLDTWTVSKYVRLPEGVGQSNVQRPDVQVVADSPTLRSLIVRSPLIVAATLMTPDLSQAEFDVLYEHYAHTFSSKDTGWQAYRKANRTDDQILVRLKMNTPYNEYYLSTDRYIIFLEDSDGTGYEPSRIDADPVRKLEALEIRLPGQTVTYTDVFGTYTGQPGYKETRTLSNPSKIRYTGQQRLVRLYFPAKDFSGAPIVTGDTRELKLVIQPDLENLPRMELAWDLKRKPKEKK